MAINTCYSNEDITALGGTIEQNLDGTVSVYIPDSGSGVLVPLFLGKTCCEVLGFFYDIDAQTCRYSRLNTVNIGCSLEDEIKIVLNSNGSDGSMFIVESSEECSLTVSFDYLLNIKCNTLNNILFPTKDTAVCDNILQAFESLDVSMTLDVLTGTTLTTVYENNFFPSIGSGNLYTYISGHSGTTGFYVCGPLVDTSIDTECHGLILGEDTGLDCGTIGDTLIDALWDESALSGDSNGNTIFESNIHSDSFNSNWVRFSVNISDPAIISQIINQTIKIGVKVNKTCADFCVLLDNIVMNKECTVVDRNDIFVTQSPGFILDRVRDNKKSWIANTSLEHREFDIRKEDNTVPIRQTDYFTNNEKLVINTKEIDLDISLASGVETDVWCYINDNPCILTGVTNCDPCLSACSGDNLIDFDTLLTQPLSAVTTIEDFKYYITSELIDVKNRQTLSGYPTLRALYDRYMDSALYCSTTSSKFSYLTMEEFANLVGNYWVDIVEQVIPATTIWGSTRIYSNTVFDQQKYKYKPYTLQLCGNPFSGQTVPSPINGTSGICESVSVITTNISSNTKPLQSSLTSTCDSVCISQMNTNSEFIGTITIMSEDGSSSSDGNVSLFAG